MSHRAWLAKFDADCWASDIASFRRWEEHFNKSVTPFGKAICIKQMRSIADKYPYAKLSVPSYFVDEKGIVS